MIRALLALALLAGCAAPEPFELQGIRFVGLPAGSFTMGCDADDPGCELGASPAHRVRISRPLWVAETELTRAGYTGIRDTAPWAESVCGEDCPFTLATWWDALALANTLSTHADVERCYTLHGCEEGAYGTRPCDSYEINARTLSACEGFRLPTEAEWEYAARGDEDFAWAGSDDVDAVAWYDGNLGDPSDPDFTGGDLSPVAQKAPNGFGLYDMSGNVAEWVHDAYDGDYYADSPATDPTGPEEGEWRVARGGCWGWSADSARVTGRQAFHQDQDRVMALGFRLVRTAR